MSFCFRIKKLKKQRRDGVLKDYFNQVSNEYPRKRNIRIRVSELVSVLTRALGGFEL